MPGTSSRKPLDSFSVRQLQIIAKACKKAGLCGSYSGLKKAQLIELLQKVEPEKLDPYRSLSIGQRAWAYRNEIAIALTTLGVLLAIVFWLCVRNA